jgi:hypothetical protein
MIGGDFISSDSKRAIQMHNENLFVVFEVGETVAHQDKRVGQAKILSFEIDIADNSIKVITDKGYARLQFIEKVNPGTNVDQPKEWFEKHIPTDGEEYCEIVES